jgi:hypothetical protein
MKELITPGSHIAENNVSPNADGGSPQPDSLSRQTRKRSRVTNANPNSEDELAGDNTLAQKPALKKRATPRSNAKIKVSNGPDFDAIDHDTTTTTSQVRHAAAPKFQTLANASPQPRRSPRTPAQSGRKRNTPASKAKELAASPSHDADFTPVSVSKRNKATPKQTPKQTPGTKSRTEAAKNRKYEPIHAVTYPKSPLISGNILAILQSPLAWTYLSRSQQRELLALLPPAASAGMRAEEAALVESCDMKSAPTSGPGQQLDPGTVTTANAQHSSVGSGEDTALPNVPLTRLKHSNAFQTDVRQFQDDLRDGKLDPVWMEMAANASIRRQSGEFDAWKKKEIERIWGLEDEVEKESKEESPKEEAK